MARNSDDDNPHGRDHESSEPSSRPSNKSKLTPELQKRLNENHEEALLLNRFKQVATSRLEEMALQSETSGVKYQMGDQERKIFQSLYGMGITEGIVAGIVTFVVLRKGPVYIARYVYNRKMAAAQGGHPTPQHPSASPWTSPPSKTPDGYQFSLPNSATGGNPTSHNPFQVGIRQDYPRSRNWLVRSIWFAFDSLLSVMMAASVSMAYTDVDQIKDQIVKLPLAPGPSLTSDALCKAITKELALVRKENSPAYQRLLARRYRQHDDHDSTKLSPPPPYSFYFQAIQEFGANCERRYWVERSIRQEQLGLLDQQSQSSSSPSSSPTLLQVEVKEAIPPDAPRLRTVLDDDDHETLHSYDFEDIDWSEADENFTQDQLQGDARRR